ncbi:MAG TPA: DUF3455 domain-containing protein [Anaeromyxobacter sp.]
MSLRRGVAAAFGLFAAALPAERATAAETRASTAHVDMPAALALPPDEAVVLELSAKGTQNYECRSKQDAPEQYEWVFVAPEADLFDGRGKKIGKHYAGPTWESTTDGSKVVGAVKARAESPEADAIPWLLLVVKEPPGTGTFARITSVQRAETHGGKPPAGGCQRGEARKVPYRAVYYFSRPRS